jgi:ketosteroid isomerase-like protein
MKKSFFTLFLFLFVCGWAGAAEKGMSEIGEAFTKAFQANDLEAIVALYGPDSEMFPPDSMEAVGLDAIRASYAGFMNTHTIQKFEVIEAHHETHGNLSFSWGRFALDMVPKAGGDAIHMEGRFSDVSKKVNGKWVYVVDHASVPFTPPANPPAKQ